MGSPSPLVVQEAAGTLSRCVPAGDGGGVRGLVEGMSPPGTAGERGAWQKGVPAENGGGARGRGRKESPRGTVGERGAW